MKYPTIESAVNEIWRQLRARRTNTGAPFLVTRHDVGRAMLEAAPVLIAMYGQDAYRFIWFDVVSGDHRLN